MDRNTQNNRKYEKYGFYDHKQNIMYPPSNMSQHYPNSHYIPSNIPYQNSQYDRNYSRYNNPHNHDIMGNRSFNTTNFNPNLQFDNLKSANANNHKTFPASYIKKQEPIVTAQKTPLPNPPKTNVVHPKRSKSTSESSRKPKKESISVNLNMHKSDYPLSQTKELSNKSHVTKESSINIPNPKESVINPTTTQESVPRTPMMNVLISQSQKTKETPCISSDTKRITSVSSKKRESFKKSPNKIASLKTKADDSNHEVGNVTNSDTQSSKLKELTVVVAKMKESDTKSNHFDITHNVNDPRCPSNTAIPPTPKHLDNNISYTNHENQAVDQTHIILGDQVEKEVEKVVPPSPLERKRHRSPSNTEISKKPRLEVNEGKINWTCIQVLDDEIVASKKAIKDQVNIVKKLRSEYEIELQKLKNMKEAKTCKVGEREKVFKALQSVVEDSSDDDDVEIVNVIGPTTVIAVDSSSESESSSDESCKVSHEPVVVNIPRGNADEPPSGSVNSSKSTTQGLSDSFSLIPPGPECDTVSTVEPKLETIHVNTQDKSYIIDIKVFNDRLFVASNHGILRQYDMKTHECVLDYLGHSQVIHSILPCGTGVCRLFSGGYDNKLLVHNIDTAELVDSVRTKSPIMSICESYTFVYLGTSAGKILSYSKIDLKGIRKEFQVVQGGLACIACAKDSSQSMLFVGTNNGQLSLWDAEKSVKLRDISLKEHRGIPIGFVTLSKQRLLVYSKSNIHFIYYGNEKSPITVNQFTTNNSLCITKNYAIIGTTGGSILVHRMKGSVIYKTPVVVYSNTDSPILSITFYNNTIISGDKRGNIYFNRLIES